MFQTKNSRATLQEQTSGLSSIYEKDVSQSNVSETILKIPDPVDTISRVRSQL